MQTKEETPGKHLFFVHHVQTTLKGRSRAIEITICRLIFILPPRTLFCNRFPIVERTNKRSSNILTIFMLIRQDLFILWFSCGPKTSREILKGPNSMKVKLNNGWTCAFAYALAYVTNNRFWSQIVRAIYSLFSQFLFDCDGFGWIATIRVIM